LQAVRLSVLALCSLAGAAFAQAPALAPQPPRIPTDGPGRVSLAAIPAERAAVMEEVVVIGPSSEWDLPELGGRQLPATGADLPWKINWLPLYAPDSPGPALNLFQAATEQQRGNFIELFRVRFGVVPERPE
jgi:hypothetical protein